MKKTKQVTYYLILFFSLLSFSMACHNKEKTTTTDTAGILIGPIIEQELLNLSPAYAREKNAYRPDSVTISFLQKIDSDINILVFLGTWCSDCQRELPRFLKIVEAMKNNHFTCQLIGVDRSKQDPQGLAEQYQIEFVPTFIVQKNGRELGRIVEAPMLSIEQDLQEILSVIF